MSIIRKPPLQSEAVVIRDEYMDKANTATRVGAELLALVNAVPMMVDVTSYGADPSYTGAVNDAAIALAITDAVAGNAEIWWPNGTYTSAASLANFHSVRHRGPGRILRGSNTFYVEPKAGQTNRLYVSTAGDAGNDGLTASQPMLTFQNAFDALKNYGPVLNGDWRVIAAAGTYSLHSQTHDTPSRQNVIIDGPVVAHPGVPTCILDGTGFASGQHGMRISGSGVKGYVRYIKFQDYNAGTNGTIGLVGEHGAVLNTLNVHADNCDWTGIYCFETALFRIEGGILNNCRSGFVANATSGTLGYGATALAEGTQITNCTQSGVYWSRGAQGHVDYCSIDNCIRGIDIDTNARVHTVECDISNNTTAGIQTASGGVFFDSTSAPSNFNDGTPDANGVRWLTHAYSGAIDGFLDSSYSEVRRALDTTTYNHTGTLTKTSIATPFTIPAYWFEDPTKKIRVRVFGNLPNRAGTAIGVDFGATEIDLSTVVGTPAASAGFIYECEVWANSASSQRWFSRLDFSAGTPRIQTASDAADTSVDLDIDVTVQLADIADTVTIRRIEVWLV